MSTPIVSRAYNTFTIEPHGSIRKFSTTQRLADEINYYKIIQQDINKAMFFPRLFASNIEEHNNWMQMEHYDYNDLGQYLMGRNIKLDWSHIFTELSYILDQFNNFTDDRPANTAYTTEMFIDKTYREFNVLVANRPDLEQLFSHVKISVNNIDMFNFPSIWPTVVKYITRSVLEYSSVMIHGDMCFSNILYSPKNNILKFIDPRGSFGVQGIYGDQRYDIAKLYHSIDGGYEFFINDLYILHSSPDFSEHIMMLDALDERIVALTAFEDQFFSTGMFNKKHIKLIEGCIFIGMCSHHYDDVHRQEAMYLTGCKLLNEALQL
jgi:hypothetical protein